MNSKLDADEMLRALQEIIDLTDALLAFNQSNKPARTIAARVQRIAAGALPHKSSL